MRMKSVLARFSAKRGILVAGSGAILALALGGCGRSFTSPSASSSAQVSFSGHVHGGQQPVTGSSIQIYAVAPNGSTASVLLNSTPVYTDATGAFNVTGLYACPSASSNIYMVAIGGDPGFTGGQTNPALALMVALGHCGNLTPSTFIAINEVTTVAAVYALAPYMQSYDHVSSAASDSAFSLASELADSSSGLTPGSASTGLNIPATKVRALANIIASCVNSTGVNGACNQLFTLTQSGSTSMPSNTISAVLGIANNPTQNVAALYNETSATSPFLPSLSAAPADWALPVTSTAPALAIASAALPATVTGVKYSAALQAQGGTPSYTWSVRSGSLPSGLSLAPTTGMITGIPTSSGTSAFTVQVADKSSPSQVAAAPLAITAAATPLTVSGSLPSGTAGIAYAAGLTASGGTPAYTWKVTNGSLPAGLTLAATTGVISGTPNASGISTFTLVASDNGNPAQTATSTISMSIAAAVPVVAAGHTWYIRTDGGTRYSPNVSQGQCDGLADVAYSGTGVNQHCAFNDFRYMWDDRSGLVGAGAWVIAGGDTIVIRGCQALPQQQNATNPNCRIGWDGAWGAVSGNWCYGVGSYTCYNPPIPAGTPTNHTKILGGCAYGTYTCTPISNNYPYASTNETQLYGGFSLTWTFNLAGTQNVDIEGIELTTHNGQCTRGGAPAYPRGCNINQPLDDFAQNGFLTDNTTANLTLQDVYIHGFNAAGLFGPIGGAITATRVFSGFNGFAGWNFADGSDTPDAPGSSIVASYVTMIGNGCYEQYPIVNGSFPAQACYDDLSQGFGDAWSGQDTLLDTLLCDHCVQKYNTKDGFIGPHTQIKHLTIINSASVGNMGSQWKFGTDTNATVLFQNNVTEGNPYRMADALPGAAHNFSAYASLPGAYLSDFARAGGDTFSIIVQAGSSLNFSGNSMVIASATAMDINCGAVNRQGNTSGNGTCSAVPIVWTNNLFLGYTDPNCGSCGGLAPGLFYKADPSINISSSYNLEYGIRNGDPCGTNNILCTYPLLQNEPAGAWPGSEPALDAFDPASLMNSFHPATGSPLLGAGKAISGLTKDFYGVAQPIVPTIGAVAN